MLQSAKNIQHRPVQGCITDGRIHDCLCGFWRQRRHAGCVQTATGSCVRGGGCARGQQQEEKCEYSTLPIHGSGDDADGHAGVAVHEIRLYTFDCTGDFNALPTGQYFLPQHTHLHLCQAHAQTAV